MNRPSPHEPPVASCAEPGPVNFSSVLVRALLAYSVYEHGYERGTATRIALKLWPRACTVEDNGRGIGLHREGYVSGLVEQLAVRVPAVALHGLGLAVIAMSSPSMVIESRRDGVLYTQRFAWGVAQGGVRREEWEGPSGTRLTVTLPDNAPAIDFDKVMEQAEFWRVAHPGLQIEVSCSGDELLPATVLQSELRCPHCGFASIETMPTDACLYFHRCAGCQALLTPKAGDCCVFCSYGSVKCPPVQEARGCCAGPKVQ